MQGSFGKELIVARKSLQVYGRTQEKRWHERLQTESRCRITVISSGKEKGSLRDRPIAARMSFTRGIPIDALIGYWETKMSRGVIVMGMALEIAKEDDSQGDQVLRESRLTWARDRLGGHRLSFRVFTTDWEIRQDNPDNSKGVDPREGGGKKNETSLNSAIWGAMPDHSDRATRQVNQTEKDEKKQREGSSSERTRFKLLSAAERAR